jgi:hypothetical protein
MVVQTAIEGTVVRREIDDLDGDVVLVPIVSRKEDLKKHISAFAWRHFGGGSYAKSIANRTSSLIFALEVKAISFGAVPGQGFRRAGNGTDEQPAYLLSLPFGLDVSVACCAYRAVNTTVSRCIHLTCSPTDLRYCLRIRLVRAFLDARK